MNETVLAEKKAAAVANSSLDVAALSMDTPDQALFSMDDPNLKPNADLAPGGVMVVSHDDNMITAQQQKSDGSGDLSLSGDMGLAASRK